MFDPACVNYVLPHCISQKSVAHFFEHLLVATELMSSKSMSSSKRMGASQKAIPFSSPIFNIASSKTPQLPVAASTVEEETAARPSLQYAEHAEMLTNCGLLESSITLDVLKLGNHLPHSSAHLITCVRMLNRLESLHAVLC